MENRIEKLISLSIALVMIVLVEFWLALINKIPYLSNLVIAMGLITFFLYLLGFLKVYYSK